MSARIAIINILVQSAPYCMESFLSIELDIVRMVRRLTNDKLTEVKQAVVSWLQRKDPKYCSLQALRSLIGKLQHASKVIRPVRLLWAG